MNEVENETTVGTETSTRSHALRGNGERDALRHDAFPRRAWERENMNQGESKIKNQRYKIKNTYQNGKWSFCL